MSFFTTPHNLCALTTPRFLIHFNWAISCQIIHQRNHTRKVPFLHSLISSSQYCSVQFTEIILFKEINFAVTVMMNNAGKTLFHTCLRSWNLKRRYFKNDLTICIFKDCPIALPSIPQINRLLPRIFAEFQISTLTGLSQKFLKE